MAEVVIQNRGQAEQLPAADRAISSGRRALRNVMYQAGLVAAHHNPNLKVFAERLRSAGRPHKVIITAVARKLVTLANSLCKNHQAWAPAPP